MVQLGAISVAGFLNGVVDYHQASREATLPRRQPSTIGGFTAAAATSPLPPSVDRQAQPPFGVRPATSGSLRRTWVGKSSALTHAQMAAYLQTAQPRLSPRELHAADRQWKEAIMYKWLTQKAGHYVPRNSLTDERKAALKECFALMDADGSGEIDFPELAIAMRALGFGNDEIREAIRQGDYDGDGTLNFEEFTYLITQASSKSSANGSGGADASFPFGLIADSYRIKRLVDSYKPVVTAVTAVTVDSHKPAIRDAAIGLSSDSDGTGGNGPLHPTSGSGRLRANSMRRVHGGSSAPSSPRSGLPVGLPPVRGGGGAPASARASLRSAPAQRSVARGVSFSAATDEARAPVAARPSVSAQGSRPPFK